MSPAEIHDIDSLVRRIYRTGSSATQGETLDFIGKVLDELSAARSAEDNEENGRFFREIFSLYFNTVFIYSKDRGIITQAVEHAVKLLEPTQPLSTHALESFKLDSFKLFRIRRWSESNVRHLLAIASARIRRRSPRLFELEAFNRFLKKVCYRAEGSCEIIAGLSEVVANIYYALKIIDKTAWYNLLNKTLLFRTILTHVNFTRQRNCWLAVATFIRVLLS